MYFFDLLRLIVFYRLSNPRNTLLSVFIMTMMLLYTLSMIRLRCILLVGSLSSTAGLHRVLSPHKAAETERLYYLAAQADRIGHDVAETIDECFFAILDEFSTGFVCPVQRAMNAALLLDDHALAIAAYDAPYEIR